MSRYVVTEIEGYNLRSAGAPAKGLSVHVIDTLVNYRVVSTWRSEDYGAKAYPSRMAKDTDLRARARKLAAQLNVEHEASLA